MNKRKCTLCKNFDKYKEFNCMYFKIKIEDPEVATKCTNFIPKRKESRKPCKDCVYYVRNPKVIQVKKNKVVFDKRFYYCLRLNKRGTYLKKVNCKYFSEEL
ncbi:hypothetical protein [Clostridium perfringens]|uniref:hypothetical protein n=1 Tax=Clostridium perfringens TaxID=1502 RepID=UPI0023F66F95|nr:hypothetical protein [Clostridium perfringens]WEV23716.1 hypothetical protein PL327_16250 [Clostridium perfringens D]